MNNHLTVLKCTHKCRLEQIQTVYGWHFFKADIASEISLFERQIELFVEWIIYHRGFFKVSGIWFGICLKTYNPSIKRVNVEAVVSPVRLSCM